MSTLRLFEASILIGLTFASPAARAAPPESPATSDDALAEHRERFKIGMDRYNSGAISEAIGYWEPIYRQLGLHAGYRLAYNLGVAYAHLDDATRSAERLQAFLDEVDARREHGEALGATVAIEESDAHRRLADLTANRARIRIPATDPPVPVQVDANEPRLAGFVAWVLPGEHTVTFEPQGSASETKVVQASAGDVVEVSPPAPRQAPPAPESTSPAPVAKAEMVPEGAPLFPPRPDVTSKTEPPFSPAVPVTSAGLDVAFVVAAIVLESRASTMRGQLVGEESVSGSISATDRQRFDAARTWAYTAVAGAAGCGAITAGLVSWYLLGSSKHAVLIQPVITPEKGGATAGAIAHF
jgi:hypothetical protein